MCTCSRVVNSGLQPTESGRGIQSHSLHIARMKVLASEEASLNSGIIQNHCKRVPVSELGARCLSPRSFHAG